MSIQDDDFDFTDIQGEVSTTTLEEAFIEALAPDEVEEKVSEEEQYARVVKSLAGYKDFAWIALPIAGTPSFLEGEIHTCSSKLFFDWINHMWPPAREMKHSPEDYEKIENRILAHKNIIETHKSIKIEPKPKPEPIRRKKGNK